MTAEQEIGLADLRQRASDVVRRVENGEEFVVTVSGRPAARLVPIERRTWVSGSDLDDILAGAVSWGPRDRGNDLLDESPRDPWPVG